MTEKEKKEERKKKESQNKSVKAINRKNWQHFYLFISLKAGAGAEHPHGLTRDSIDG